MLETLHGIGSRLRRLRVLGGQGWLWRAIEPRWQSVFKWLSRDRGFLTPINEDAFRLVYDVGSRYSRPGSRSYEPAFYHAFIERINLGMTVFDIGAHIGMFTLGAAKRVGPKGRVFAFEPSPETALLLERHVHLNDCCDRVEIVKSVVSDVDGIVPFYTGGATMAASLSRENVEVTNPEQLTSPVLRVEVSSVTLDRFCAIRNVRPHVVKIDVEGAELLALRGAKELLQDHQLLVLCEIHPAQMLNCGTSLTDLTDYLGMIGYSMEVLDAPNELGIYHTCIVARRSSDGAVP